MPLGDHLRAQQDRRTGARELLEQTHHAPAPRGRVGVQPHQPRVGHDPRQRLLQCLGARPLPPEVDRAARRACRGRHALQPAVVAREPLGALIAVQHHRHVAVGAARNPSARPAQRGARKATPVQEDDRLLPALAGLLQRCGERTGHRTGRLRAHVHHLHGRQLRAIGTPGKGDALQGVPGLGAGRRAAEHDGRPGVERPPVRHLPGVVPRRGVLLVRRVVLLVHDHQPEGPDGREHRAAGAQHHVCLTPGDAVVLGRPLGRGEGRVPDRHALSQARTQAPQQLRSEGDLRHEHQRAPPPRTRLVDRTQVHLGLARPGHAMQEQGIRFRRSHRARDPLHGVLLLPGEVRWRVRGRGGPEPVEPAGIRALAAQVDHPLVRHAPQGGHGGSRQPHQVGGGKGAACSAELREHRRAAPRGRGRGVRVTHARHQAGAPAAGGRPEAPGTVRAPPQGAFRARGKHQLETGPERRQGAPRDPPGQREQLGRHRGGVHHPCDGREGAGVRGRLASHHHAEHGSRTEAHGHEGTGSRRALEGLGHAIVERPVEGAGGDQGDDLRGRPPVRRVSQPARPRWPCSPR